ncbi:uncharacterized protein [Asterias amurensis]|uniref:uncharacterized protein n=1 Tax=Asterias amurensis TaxID=7602 RepID=UPI003AB335BC
MFETRLCHPALCVVTVINPFRKYFNERFTMNNALKLELPQRRRSSSWNPPPNLEWNETTSSLQHLRNSLLKDDGLKASCLQSEMQTKPKVFEAMKSPRRRVDVYTWDVPPNPKVPPKPQRRRVKSSTDGQNNNSNDTEAPTGQSKYILDNALPEPESVYMKMQPIKPLPAIPKKEKQNGLPDSQTNDLQKRLSGHLICKVCNKQYNQPKMLMCSHSFCSHCLSETIQHPTPLKGTIPCPTCAKDTPIPVNGLNGLPDNTLLQDLIDDVSKHESSHVGQRSDDPVFLQEPMKSSNDSKMLRVHNRSVKTYEVMLLKKDKPLEPFLTDYSAGNSKQCVQHPNNELTHFCRPCKKLICSECLKVDHNATKHHYVDAALAEVEWKNVMKLLLEMIKKQKDEFVQSVRSLEDAYCRLHSMTYNTKKKIMEQEKYQIQKIRERSAALLEEATQLSNDRADKIEEQHRKHCEGAEMASSNQNILEHAINKASQLEVLIARDNVAAQCNKLLKEVIDKPMHKLSFLDFAEAQEGSKITMGHVLQTENWELQEELVESTEEAFQLAGYLAMYSNGDLALTDMLKWQLTVISQDTKRCKRIEKSDKALLNPFAVAINKDDQLLVIDQNMVKVFDNEINYLFDVQIPFLQRQDDEHSAPSIITCLAVDKQNRIAVGNLGKKAVSLHHPDGKLLRVLPADLIDMQMTMANGERIIYSNYQKRTLVSMDYKGNIVFCVSTADKSPTGVCCDAFGFIYVAVHSTFKGMCEIHHYNRTGELLGCMVEGLYNPLGIIFTPRDNLAVADKDSVKIYRRV